MIPQLHEPWSMDRDGMWKPLTQIELEMLEQEKRGDEIALGVAATVALVGVCVIFVVAALSICFGS
jgi:hypothetical protein